MTKEKIRVWCDGCYDMVHFGHSNSLRQAKQMGSYLIVGVHTDAEINKHKGPPLFNESERYRMIRAIKWVDEVVEGAPYVTTVEKLDEYGVDFCVHGNDITTTSDGTDTYELVKRAKRYRECERTQGISTTDLVGRMLLLTRNHQLYGERALQIPEQQSRELSSDRAGSTPWRTAVSKFLPTTQRIVDFSNARRRDPLKDKVAYVPGAFDLFHIGHLDFLEETLRVTGATFLIIGLYTDVDINQRKGANYPIMNLHERALNVLAYRCVDEVVIGAPHTVTSQVIDHFQIDFVCQGNLSQESTKNDSTNNAPDEDPFGEAKRRGIYRVIQSTNEFTNHQLFDRIVSRRREYEERNIRKNGLF